MRKRNPLKVVLVPVILLALVIVILYSGLQILESTVLQNTEKPAQVTTTKTISRNGIEYFPRQYVTVMMVLGIDQMGPVTSSNYHRNNGAADSIMLLVFDENARDCTVLYLNRDTMLNMDVLGVRGEYA